VVNVESSRGERWSESSGGTHGCVRGACGAGQVDSSEDASPTSPGAQVLETEGETGGLLSGMGGDVLEAEGKVLRGAHPPLPKSSTTAARS
jgi:hypothetical protein